MLVVEWAVQIHKHPKMCLCGCYLGSMLAGSDKYSCKCLLYYFSFNTVDTCLSERFGSLHTTDQIHEKDVSKVNGAIINTCMQDHSSGSKQASKSKSHD